MFLVSVAEFHRIHVPVRQAALVEEIALERLDDEVESPEIAGVLVGGRGFHGGVDDAELGVVRAEAGVSGEFVDAGGGGLLDPGGTAIRRNPG